MLYLRYAVGGKAELSAADTLALDDMASGQEGGPAVKVNMVRVVHEYLIDAMREVKVDQASTAGVACLDVEAKQAQGTGMRQCCFPKRLLICGCHDFCAAEGLALHLMLSQSQSTLGACRLSSPAQSSTAQSSGPREAARHPQQAQNESAHVAYCSR